MAEEVFNDRVDDRSIFFNNFSMYAQQPQLNPHTVEYLTLQGKYILLDKKLVEFMIRHKLTIVIDDKDGNRRYHKLNKKK